MASAKGRSASGALVLADVACLPCAAGCVDAIFGAGIITHVPDPYELLHALARVTRPTGRLALFHPIGHAALARRHDRALRADELLDPAVLPGALEAAGWELEQIDDADDRYLAVARRAA